jgi:hypothetical protein
MMHKESCVHSPEIGEDWPAYQGIVIGQIGLPPAAGGEGQAQAQGPGVDQVRLHRPEDQADQLDQQGGQVQSLVDQPIQAACTAHNVNGTPSFFLQRM